MKDREARGIVLQKFYDLRHTKDKLSPPDFQPYPLEERTFFNVVQQLAEEGLISWNPHRGIANGLDFFTASISAGGVKVVEGDAQAPSPIIFPVHIDNRVDNSVNSSVNVSGSQGVMLNSPGSSQTLNIDIERLFNAIDDGTINAAEKEEAKSLLQAALDNPIAKKALDWLMAKIASGGAA